MSVFLQDLDFQIIEGDLLDEIILGEPRTGSLPEFSDVGTKPGRPGQIKMKADRIKRIQDLMGAGIRRRILYRKITGHLIVFIQFSP